MAQLTQIVDGIYRLCSMPAGKYPVGFNQFLIDDERPTLIHTGFYDSYDAVRAGVAARGTGQPPYFRAIATNPAHRRGLLREGWKAVAKVFVGALVLDVIYQVMVFQWVYPFEALLVAFLLTCVPYLLMRGPAARHFHGRRRGSQDTR